MASTSAPPAETAGAGRRLAASATATCSDYQSLIFEMRKAVGLIKGVAVDLEKENQTDMVKQLDDVVLELLASSSDCAHYSSAIQAVSNGYRPPSEGNQRTNFKAKLEAELNEVKKDYVPVLQPDPLYWQFKEAIWNVHHAGQPLPGEEQEELVMTSTQGNLLNTKCPITGKAVFDLKSPVRCQDCKHIYEKDPVMHYIRTMQPHPQCPVAGCPKVLEAAKVVSDPMLPVEIDEARSRGDDTIDAQTVEDFSEDDDS